MLPVSRYFIHTRFNLKKNIVIIKQHIISYKYNICKETNIFIIFYKRTLQAFPFSISIFLILGPFYFYHVFEISYPFILSSGSNKLTFFDCFLASLFGLRILIFCVFAFLRFVLASKNT